MLDKVIRWSLQNRLVTLFSAAAVLAGGIYSAVTIPIDVFPDLTAPTVTVLTEAHGMAAEEVELLVTFPIETAVNGAAGVRRVRSSSALQSCIRARLALLPTMICSTGAPSTSQNNARASRIPCSEPP